MELIFKKYHKSEPHTEKIYLIYDPMQNPMQFTQELFRSISHRNFIQNCEKLLIGPIMDDKKMTARVFDSDGTEISFNSDIQKIFAVYLKDQGYPVTNLPESSGTAHGSSNIQAFGTVYHFTA